MSSVSYQTIRLSGGKHKSPEDGACVMELASMLAGETFSDHPPSTCPVVGAFLRAYNDSLDDDRRQDLYPYAAKVVGSRASEPVERARLERFLAWAEARRDHRWAHRRAWRRALLFVIPQPSISATLMNVARCGRPANELHREVLALIDEVLAIGAEDPAPSVEPALAPAGENEIAAFPASLRS